MIYSDVFLGTVKSSLHLLTTQEFGIGKKWHRNVLGNKGKLASDHGSVADNVK